MSLSIERAMQLCQEIQDRQFIKVFTQCWGCTTFSKGDTAKMCGAIVDCNLVLRRYNRLQKKSAKTL